MLNNQVRHNFATEILLQVIATLDLRKHKIIICNMHAKEWLIGGNLIWHYLRLKWCLLYTIYIGRHPAIKKLSIDAFAYRRFRFPDGENAESLRSKNISA